MNAMLSTAVAIPLHRVCPAAGQRRSRTPHGPVSRSRRPVLRCNLQPQRAAATEAPVKASEPVLRPRTVLVERVPPTTPSGQPGTSDFAAPCAGQPEPLGVSMSRDGRANFALFTSGATAVTLCLFTEADMSAGRTTHEIELDPESNRTGDVWHVMLPRVDTRLLYGYRLDGPHQNGIPEGENPEFFYGHRFDSTKVLLDPYARMVVGRRRFGEVGPDLDYEKPQVLGLASTWTQQACAIMADDGFDWEGDRPLGLPMEDLVIYEMHVRGFTASGPPGVDNPGTYQGLTQRLDYLTSLGVNAIELLPIHEFNELEYYQIEPEAPARYNFWGYSTCGFFSPMLRYSAAAASSGSAQEVAAELKTLVKEAHRRGIEVIMDVVFNHTAEGNEMGPSISFRGLDNRVYYTLAPQGEYYNYSGCGNTFNCNHPVARKFIVDCLRFWVTEYHIDGFRFDLASILTRANSAWQQGTQLGPESTMVPSFAGDGGRGGALTTHDGIMSNGAGVPTGTPLPDPPLIAEISEDPVLRNTKLIAEAWDCDGLNQVGAFPHYNGRWAEWNGNFRDTVRQFVKGTDGPWVGAFAEVLCGSPATYGGSENNSWWGQNAGRQWVGGRLPIHSINFITAHDGFTLADLVSYNHKHNEANGEDNNDGEEHNLSWNCGAEGDSDDPSIQRLRDRQMRNFMAALLVAQGVPMILMGDEYGHSKVCKAAMAEMGSCQTNGVSPAHEYLDAKAFPLKSDTEIVGLTWQGGNNNTYCHDSPLNWQNWAQAEADRKGLRRFVSHFVKFRRSRPELGLKYFPDSRAIQWHGKKPNAPDWSDESRLLALTLTADGDCGWQRPGLYVAWNTSHLPQTVELPFWAGSVWRLIADSSKPAPFDFLVADDSLSQSEVVASQKSASMWTAEGLYPMLPRSFVILEAVPADMGSQNPHMSLDEQSCSELSCSASPAASGGSPSLPPWEPHPSAPHPSAGTPPRDMAELPEPAWKSKASNLPKSQPADYGGLSAEAEAALKEENRLLREKAIRMGLIKPDGNI